MYKFSKVSEWHLSTCHSDLQRLFRFVVLHIDCKVICGHRGAEDQRQAFKSGASMVDWPHGKHNALPSLAVDVMPYPIVWKDERRNVYFGGFVVGAAAAMNIRIRWGHDWDHDHNLYNQKFIDSPHWELIK